MKVWFSIYENVPYLCVVKLTVRWLVQEMDSILVEQKVVSCVAEKAKWWEGRRALDCRLQVKVLVASPDVKWIYEN